MYNKNRKKFISVLQLQILLLKGNVILPKHSYSKNKINLLRIIYARRNDMLSKYSFSLNFNNILRILLKNINYFLFLAKTKFFKNYDVNVLHATFSEKTSFNLIDKLCLRGMDLRLSICHCLLTTLIVDGTTSIAIHRNCYCFLRAQLAFQFFEQFV